MYVGDESHVDVCVSSEMIGRKRERKKIIE